MTPKQQRFVEEYLIDLNATQAAIRAGYSERTANEQGARLLAKVSISDAITDAKTERSKRVELTQDWVLDRLMANAERAMQAVPVVNKDGAVIEYRYDGAVANGALNLLGKHLGMFTEKIEHTGKDGGPIQSQAIGATDTERAERAVALIRRAEMRKVGAA